MNSTQTDIPQQPPSAPGPLVSVVIPAYNAAPYIALTLNSVLAQTLANYEIIVINDGSPDTPALEQALQPYLAKIRYLRQDNRGPSSARNVGIREARGKYIAFLDSDDLWFPHHLAKHVEALQKDPSIGLIYSNAVLLEGSHPVSIDFEVTPQSLPVDFENLLLEECAVSTSSTMASRQALVEAGLFDERFIRCEDYDLWLRMARNGVKMTFTREIQMYHRLGNGLAGNRDLMRQARIEVYRKISSTQPLTERQALMARGKISQTEAEIQLDVVRQSLLAGQFDEAGRAARKATSAVHDWRLLAVQLALRLFPGLLQRYYRSHLQRVARRKREQGARLLNDLGLSTETLNLNTPAGPRTV
jgi:GT2 family glycosyltransferase